MLKSINQALGIYDKISPIHEAATLGDVAELERLVKDGTNINLKNHQQFTPLYLAVQNDNELAAKLLLDNGASAKNLMRLAVSKGNLKMLQLLDQFGADINGDKDGPTYPYMKVKDGLHLLHLAAQGGYLDIVKWLVDVKSVDVNLANNPLKQTALHFAAGKGHQEVTEFLLQKTANPDLLNLHEKAPVHLAVEQGHLPIIQTLKQYEANLDIHGSKSKITPLHIAAKHHYLAIVEYLVDTAKVNINALANSSQIGELYLPEFMQWKYSPLQAASFFPEGSETIALLVHKGATIDLSWDFGKFRGYVIKHKDAILSSGPVDRQISVGLALLKVFHKYSDLQTINFRKGVVAEVVAKAKDLSEGESKTKLSEIFSTQEYGQNFYNFCLATTKDLKFENVESDLKEPYEKMLAAVKESVIGPDSVETSAVDLTVAGAEALEDGAAAGGGQ